MYEKLNITENTLRILSLFTKGFNRDYYIREIQKMLKISPRTAQTLLEDLEKKGILQSTHRGKIRVFKLNKNLFSKNYLILTEQYKKLCLIQKNLLIKEILEQSANTVEGIGVIFGSHAKNQQKKDSDIDIFIAGKYDKEKFENLSKIFNIDINIKSCSLSTFEKNMHKDHLLVEVLKNHIVFAGSELFIETVLKDEKNNLV